MTLKEKGKNINKVNYCYEIYQEKCVNSLTKLVKTPRGGPKTCFANPGNVVLMNNQLIMKISLIKINTI